jgi:hypothetical protein
MRLALLALLLVSTARADEFSRALQDGAQAIAEQDDAPDPAAAALPDSVDLSDQWVDEAREQSPLSSCHDFAAVALLEAAHYRRTGQRLRLSEADLFARGTALRGLRSVAVSETGLLREDLRLALRTGVLPGDFYAELVKNRRGFSRLAPLAGRERGLERLLPEAAAPEAEAARDAVRQALAPLRAGGPSFFRFLGSSLRTVVAGRAVKCRGQARRRDLVMRKLAAGIPVGAGLFLNGVQDPDLNARRDAAGGEHYVVLKGYERRGGAVSFLARNSWGERPGSRARLSESDLCSVFGLSWVQAPSDPD